MEIVLRLKVLDTIVVSWERVVRGCLILILLCILYSCVRGYTADYKNEFNEIAVSKGTVWPDCGKNMSEMWVNVKNIFMKSYYLETEKSIGQGIALDMNIAEKQNIINAVLPLSGMSVSVENNILELELQPETEANQEQELLIPGSFSESKKQEQDVSFITEEEIPAEDADEMREIEGFSVDVQGYITGITGNLILIDGILLIPSGETCVGIREKAFANIGSDAEEVMEIFIPANIYDIEQGAFDNLPYLMYIEVAGDNRYYCSMDGILYTRSGEEIVCPAGR